MTNNNFFDTVINFNSYEEAFGIKFRGCRYCTSDKALNHLNPLIVPCDCNNNFAYAHAACLKSYIINSKCSQAYKYCPLCGSRYSMHLNANFSIREAKKIYYAALIFELVKCVLFVLTISSLSILVSIIFDKYIYEYSNWFAAFGLTVTTSILFVSMCLMLIILNLLALKHAISITLCYKKEKFYAYTNKNYEAYVNFANFKICDRTWKSVFLVIIILIFFPISFVLIMYCLYIYHKTNLLKNKYFCDMHIF